MLKKGCEMEKGKSKIKNVFVIIVATILILGVLPVGAYFLTTHKVSIKNKDGYLLYKHADKDINQKLTEEEKKIIEEIIEGKRAEEKMVACEFNKNVALKFGKNIYCVDCDGCGLLRVNDSTLYIEIPEEHKRAIHDIFSKYGATFPAL